jgi:hypothetical protein
MKRFTRRTITMSLLALLVGLTAAIIAVVHASNGNASPVRAATPLAQASLTRAVRSSIAGVARKDGVDPANVVELGASGAGVQRHGVLAGTDSSGAPVLAFMTGFGMSEFVPGSRFADADTPMFVSDSVSGPSTEARIVGIVGIATSAIARVTVQTANGTTVTLPLTQAPVVPYEGFSYVSSDPATFPTTVSGYDDAGKLIAEHAVDARPLCKASQPDCAG